MEKAREEIRSLVGESSAGLPKQAKLPQSPQDEIEGLLAAVLKKSPKADRLTVLQEIETAAKKMRETPKQYRIQLQVAVSNPAALLAYAQENAVRWGYDAGRVFTVEEAMYESLVNNSEEISPPDIGCEILSEETAESGAPGSREEHT